MRYARAVAPAAFAVAALPARAGAAECVRVVVDYGTSAGAGTHCTAAETNDVASDVLARRAKELGRTPPRYSSSGFLCAIDGYPETGCGDHDTEPYWSLWYFANGHWVYSSQGVTTLGVADRDGDGHPDPMGFSYTPFEHKNAPRANPAYAAPTTRPPARTTPPPAARTTPPPRPGGVTTTAAPPAPGVTAVATTTRAPGTTPPPTPLPEADHGVHYTPPPGVTPGAGETEVAAPPSAARHARGFPVGSVAGVAAGLGLAAAAWRTRRVRRTP